jgi:hypothetical protein
MNPLHFTVGFSTTKGIASAIIRWLTRSPASHTWFSFKLNRTYVVLHASSGGVAIVHRERFEEKNEVVEEFSLDLDMYPYFDELLQELGKPYDYGALIGNLFVLFGRVFGKAWPNIFQNKDSWHCSELVSFVLKEAGEEIPAAPEVVSPAMLIAMLHKSPHASIWR